MTINPDDIPPVLPPFEQRTNPDGTPTRNLIDWEFLQREFALGAFQEVEDRVSTAEGNIQDLDTFTLSLQSQVDANAASLVIEAYTRATADSAEATLRIALEASTASSFASINTTLTAQSGINSAIASQITTLDAQVGANSASISAELIARANGDSALASQIVTLNAQVGTNSADIYNESVARANADSAIAYNLSVLSSTVGSNSATLAVYGASINGVEVKFGVQGYINGVTGGFVFTGVLKNDGSVSYDMEINSNVTINGNVVVNGTLTTSKIAVNAVSQIGQNTVKAGYAQADVTMTVRDCTVILIVSVSETEGTIYTKAFSGGLIQRGFPILINGATYANLQTSDGVVDAQFLGGSSYAFTGAVIPAAASIKFALTAGTYTFSLANVQPQAMRLSIVAIELAR